MKILTVATSFPYPPDGGTKILSFERIRELSRRHDVTLLCVSSESVPEHRIREMERYCRCVLIHASPCLAPTTTTGKVWQMIRSVWLRAPHYLHDRATPEGLGWLERETKGRAFDVVEADGDACVYLRARVDALKVAIIHSITAVAARRELPVTKEIADRCRLLIYGTLTRWHEDRLARDVDLCVTVTPENLQEFQKLHPYARVRHCLSSGVDLDHFAYTPPLQAPRGVCFLGRMEYTPNVDAVLWFYRYVFPQIRTALPHFRFSVIGGLPVEAVKSLADDPSVDVTGYVDDVRPHVRAAGLMVVPMRLGSGILTKVLQSLALGVPAVTTSLALEGLSVVRDRDLLVADSPDGLATAIVRLATDDGLRMRIATAGRAYVEQHHRWSDMVQRYEAELEGLRHRHVHAPADLGSPLAAR